MKSKDIILRFLKYFLRGIKNSIIIGVPDFNTNKNSQLKLGAKAHNFTL
jgi:hypothetical protein